MSDPTTVTPEPAPSGTAPSGGPTTPPNNGGASSPPSPYRIPEDHPDPRWRGKTVDEVLGITNQALAFVERTVAQPPAPMAPAPSAPSPAINPDDYLTGRDVQTIRQQVYQEMAPKFQAVAQTAAEVAQDAVTRKFPEVFAKPGYLMEYQQLLQNIPLEQRTVSNLEWAARLVRANHVDEIAEERAQAKLRDMPPTARATGGGAQVTAPVDPFADPALPRDWLERAKEAGLTMKDIEAFCRKTGQTTDQYFADLKKYGTRRMSVVGEG